MSMNEISATDLERIVYEKRLDGLIGQYGKGYHRQIDFLVGTGEYVVLDYRETVWNGRSAEEALEAYYNIPRR